MTSTSIRTIHIDDDKYSWCIRGNGLDSAGASHITIFHPETRSKQLYLDPYPWDLEIKPATVKLAIQYALANGWLSETGQHPMYLGYLNGEFMLLPDGIKHAHELGKHK